MDENFVHGSNNDPFYKKFTQEIINLHIVFYPNVLIDSLIGWFIGIKAVNEIMSRSVLITLIIHLLTYWLDYKVPTSF